MRKKRWVCEILSLSFFFFWGEGGGGGVGGGYGVGGRGVVEVGKDKILAPLSFNMYHNIL